MIFTDRKITIRNGKSSINEPVILYRGDYEVSIKFTIMESKFRFKSGVNLVDSEKASHGQLAILAPYGGNVFSDIVKCEDGTVTFTLTKEMIDQLEEVGLYSFQIRLFDYYRESRVSIPPVEFGIEVREPVASEDHDNEVNNAIVGYSIAKVVDPSKEDVGDTFDANGQYNKTDWETGDRISEGKLNKIEDALYQINQNEINDIATLNKRVTNNYNVLESGKVPQHDFNTLKSRVDSMGVLKDGSTTGDAELMDGRVGADGIIYPTIGQAIRNQIEELQNDSIMRESIYGNGAVSIPLESGYNVGVKDIGIIVNQNNGNFYELSYTKTGVNQSASEISVRTVNKIDLTDVDYIYVDWEQLINQSSARAHLVVTEHRSATRVHTGHLVNLQKDGVFTRRIERIDVRNVKKSCYICVYAGNASSGQTMVSKVNIYSLYMVKKDSAEIDGIKNDIVQMNDDISSIKPKVDKAISGIDETNSKMDTLLDVCNVDIYSNGTFNKPVSRASTIAVSQAILENADDYYRISYVPDGTNAPQTGFTTSHPIDLTDVAEVCIEWEEVANDETIRSTFSINSSMSANRDAASNLVMANMFNGFERKVTKLNVAKYSGKYYIRVHAASITSNASATRADVRVYKLWYTKKLSGTINDIYDTISTSYDDGVRLDIYNGKDIETKISGGLVAGSKIGNTNTYEILDDKIEFKYYGQSNNVSEIGLVSDKKIDFTNVSYIIVDWEGSINVSARANICVSSNKQGNRQTGYVLQLAGGFDRKVSVIDVKSKTGELYLRVHFGANAYDVSGTGCVYSLKLIYDNGFVIQQCLNIEDDSVKALPYPEYWQAEVEDSISKIQALQAAGGNKTTSVGFITDIHANTRDIISAPLLETIMNECDIPYYFDGGDVVRGAGLEMKETLLYYIRKEREAFANLHDRCMRVIGNHDPAYSELGGTAYYEQNLTLEETYHEFFRPSTVGTKLIWGDEGRYFYADDQAHRIRYIGLDSTDTPYPVNKMRQFCFREQQLQWLANVALNVPDNTWSVVVCSHNAPTTYNVSDKTIINSNIVLDILKSFNDGTKYTGTGSNSTYPVSIDVDYTNKGGDVICWMYGHVHVDSINVANGITLISTEADTMDSGDNCTAGTITEHAFDIFTINKQTRTVNVTRVGFGEDRSFTY